VTQRPGDTLEEPPVPQGSIEPERPGLLVVLCCGQPVLRAVPLDRRITVGRDRLAALGLSDNFLSSEHFDIALEGGRITIVDRSRNGTFVDGTRVAGSMVAEAPRVIRAGRSLFVPVRDVAPFEGRDVVVTDHAVIGPTLQRAIDRITYAGRVGEGLLITGESGTGKESAAATFHAASPNASGPLVAVNCATIPEGLAERLLFGAKRGAFSGASSDAAGYLQAAEGGVLFLDEIGELEPDVQPKLLRVLESKELLVLGATRPRQVNVRFVCATHRDLRAAVASGQFRADLYYRISQQQVALPPLRARPEEIPFHVGREIGRLGATLGEDGRFVEACLLRTWPGNVRELIHEVRRAGHEALASGIREVRAEHLAPHAGTAFGEEEEVEPIAIAQAPAGSPRTSPPTREAIEAIFRAHGGNVAATARALGLHRMQVYRLLRRFGLASG